MSIKVQKLFYGLLPELETCSAYQKRKTVEIIMAHKRNCGYDGTIIATKADNYMIYMAINNDIK